MYWTRFALITLAAGVFTSLTDWLMAGDWLHRRYSYPEAWRKGVDSKAIALISPLPFLTCGGLAYLLARLGVHFVAPALKLAVADRPAGDGRVLQAASGVCGLLYDELTGEAGRGGAGGCVVDAKPIDAQNR